MKQRLLEKIKEYKNLIKTTQYNMDIANRDGDLDEWKKQFYISERYKWVLMELIYVLGEEK